MDKCQNELLDLLNKYCKNKSVIEFGPLNGYVTEVILETNPKHLTCVEPDPMMIHELSGSKFSQIDELLSGTANDFYNESLQHKADVVISFGVIYHLHSPLHFIEQIVNKSLPEVVMLEPLFPWEEDRTCEGDFEVKGYYSPEPHNQTGFAFGDSKITNPLTLALHTDSKLFIKAFDILGYDFEQIEVTSKFLKNEHPTRIGIFNRRGG